MFRIIYFFYYYKIKNISAVEYPTIVSGCDMCVRGFNGVKQHESLQGWPDVDSTEIWASVVCAAG